MAELFQIKLITPRETVYDGAGLAVTIPAVGGEIQVYPGHIPVLARTVPGTVKIENPGAPPVTFDVDEGYARITPNEVHLLVDAVKTDDGK